MCVCVCVYVCVCVCMCVYMCVRAYVCVVVYMCGDDTLKHTEHTAYYSTYPTLAVGIHFKCQLMHHHLGPRAEH